MLRQAAYQAPSPACPAVRGAQANVLAPNKHSAAAEAMWRGHLLDSETYIGGKVEALESGIFRSDLPTRFKLQPAAYQVPAPLLEPSLLSV